MDGAAVFSSSGNGGFIRARGTINSKEVSVLHLLLSVSFCVLLSDSVDI